MDCFIVDADAVSRRLASLLLQRLGYPSPTAADRAEALPTGIRGLVLVGTDEAAAGVAKLQAMMDPACRAQSRLVATLGSASDGARQACLRAGADAVLVKPLALQTLKELLSQAQPGDDFNALAWGELLQLFGADGAARLAGALIDDLPTQQQRVAAATREQDLPALGRVAHALRGVSLQLGAEALAALCTEAETAATAGRTEAAIALSARLIRRHEALVERLRDETAKH